MSFYLFSLCHSCKVIFLIKKSVEDTVNSKNQHIISLVKLILSRHLPIYLTQRKKQATGQPIKALVGNFSDFFCRLCFSTTDDLHHLFCCPPSKQLISFTKLLQSIKSCNNLLTLCKDNQLFNYTALTGTKHLIITKMSSLIGNSTLQLRKSSFFL